MQTAAKLMLLVVVEVVVVVAQQRTKVMAPWACLLQGGHCGEYAKLTHLGTHALGHSLVWAHAYLGTHH